ncbi:MAG: 2-oxoglutarate:ferredoxin oxidoreductase [Nitrospirae bacterium]|nr:2-oxoglutarate:ferredoxin oxidoreductase [Nitrospirota bacterium]MBI3594497.1 2-oxoglutarate:ferredoxin oxidoreductase [Nitrospirota bacterium]
MPTDLEQYRVLPGPEGILPPAAAYMGVLLPEEGQGLLEGDLVNEEKAMEAGAIAMLTRKNPTLFPGPLIVWGWDAHTNEKAKIVLEIAQEIPGVRIIPMPDYRPIYPKIDPEAVINPCHPNLTILHNKIEACVLVGVHCHYANVTLKMIRAGTNCYTIALCAAAGHEDAMMSVPNCDREKLIKFRNALRRVKKNGVKPKYEGKGIIPSSAYQSARLTGQDFHPVPEAEAHGLGHDLEKGLDENEE